MDLKDYILHESGISDLRFGIIDIYDHKTNPEDNIFCKVSQSSTSESHNKRLQLAHERLNLTNPYLLKMLQLECDDKFWILRSFFVYPNHDLRSRASELEFQANELLKFIHDVLSATAFLESKRLVHGDVRSEFIYYDAKYHRYILVDRLGSLSEMNVAQYENIQDGQFLYMSPILFDELMSNNLEVDHNPFKSEVFSVGMLILDFFADEIRLQSIYSQESGKFDRKKFEDLLCEIKSDVFNKPENKMIGDFLSDVLLNINEKERKTSISALRIFRETLWKTCYKRQPFTDRSEEVERKFSMPENGKKDLKLNEVFEVSSIMGSPYTGNKNRQIIENVELRQSPILNLLTSDIRDSESSELQKKMSVVPNTKNELISVKELDALVLVQSQINKKNLPLNFEAGTPNVEVNAKVSKKASTGVIPPIVLGGTNADLDKRYSPPKNINDLLKTEIVSSKNSNEIKTGYKVSEKNQFPIFESKTDFKNCLNIENKKITESQNIIPKNNNESLSASLNNSVIVEDHERNSYSKEIKQIVSSNTFDLMSISYKNNKDPRSQTPNKSKKELGNERSTSNIRSSKQNTKKLIEKASKEIIIEVLSESLLVNVCGNVVLQPALESRKYLGFRENREDGESLLNTNDKLIKGQSNPFVQLRASNFILASPFQNNCVLKVANVGVNALQSSFKTSSLTESLIWDAKGPLKTSLPQNANLAQFDFNGLKQSGAHFINANLSYNESHVKTNKQDDKKSNLIVFNVIGNSVQSESPLTESTIEKKSDKPGRSPSTLAQTSLITSPVNLNIEYNSQVLNGSTPNNNQSNLGVMNQSNLGFGNQSDGSFNLQNSFQIPVRSLNVHSSDIYGRESKVNQDEKTLVINGKKLYLCRVENGLNVYRYFNE